MKYYPEGNESTIFFCINALKLFTEDNKYIYWLIKKWLQQHTIMWFIRVGPDRSEDFALQNGDATTSHNTEEIPTKKLVNNYNLYILPKPFLTTYIDW